MEFAAVSQEWANGLRADYLLVAGMRVPVRDQSGDSKHHACLIAGRTFDQDFHQL
jgi:hypothetical protein